MAIEMRYSLAIAFFAIAIVPGLVLSQENAQTTIPRSLLECYQNTDIYERDNRLPATVNTLIELIRKVEYSNDYNRDLKEIAVSILHRFRMDGIQRAPGNVRRRVLPFSPYGFQFSKHRLLLSRLIPGNVNAFPNNTLSSVERCALHFLISSSIDGNVRGDEATRCGQLAQFRSARMYQVNEFGRKKRYAPYGPRQVPRYQCDREMTSETGECLPYPQLQYPQPYPVHGRQHPGARRPNLQQPLPYETSEHDLNNDNDGYGDGNYPLYGNDQGQGEPIDDGYGNVDEPEVTPGKPKNFGGHALYDVASNAISQCPVENGVMRTAWGAVAAGPLIAGIAAGLVQQNVAAMELLKYTKNYNQGNNNNDRGRPLIVDNRWAATLAGDLAEVALLQSETAQDYTVGAAGAWNSTTVPHWYFLSQRERLEMTDAEIRGGIDGLAMGLNIAQWRRDLSQLRLSQLLDMYYSNHGILSKKFRSCNRRELFNELIQPQQLLGQAYAFSTVLSKEMVITVTLDDKEFQTSSRAATDALMRHMSNGLNDVACDAGGVTQIETRTRANIHIFVETTWQFNEIQPALATLLENLDINRFDSQFTLYNANDAATLVNTSSSLLDFYMLWNQTSHSMQTPGFNLAAVIKKVREVGAQILDEERAKNQASGRSFIALVIPQLSGVNEADSNFVAEQLVSIRERNPDLKLLFWAGGSHGRFSRFVQDQNRDLFPLMAFSSSGDSSQQINSYTQPLIKRIKQVPRRISNPRCNSEWQQNDWGQNNFDQYVEPSGVNFYRLSPNYFYRSGGTVRIQSRQQSQIIVCSSRNVELPRYANNSQQVEGVSCRQLMNSETFDYGLTGACDGHYLIQNCPPLYISVQAAPTDVQSLGQCTDITCRFPNDIKFNINMDNLGCYSSTTKLMCESIAIVFSLVLICLQKSGVF